MHAMMSSQPWCQRKCRDICHAVLERSWKEAVQWHPPMLYGEFSATSPTRVLLSCLLSWSPLALRRCLRQAAACVTFKPTCPERLPRHRMGALQFVVWQQRHTATALLLMSRA